MGLYRHCSIVQGRESCCYRLLSVNGAKKPAAPVLSVNTMARTHHTITHSAPPSKPCTTHPASCLSVCLSVCRRRLLLSREQLSTLPPSLCLIRRSADKEFCGAARAREVSAAAGVGSGRTSPADTDVQSKRPLPCQHHPTNCKN